MSNLYDRLKLWQKFLLVICAFALALGVLGLYVIKGFNGYIEFAQKEIYGNAYQRPLEELLEFIPQHQILARRYHNGEQQVRGDLGAKQAQIDGAFDALESVDKKLGKTLQFDGEGLAKRNRQHAHVQNVRSEWQSIKSDEEKLAPADSDEKHRHLVSDLRTMITHSGDNSNLILDPDLDSYYMMDVTLLALPQTQDRLATVIDYGEKLLKQKSISKQDAIQLAVHNAMLKEADLDRIVGSTQTALLEDRNFYGVSDRFQRNIPPALGRVE